MKKLANYPLVFLVAVLWIQSFWIPCRTLQAANAPLTVSTTDDQIESVLDDILGNDPSILNIEELTAEKQAAVPEAYCCEFNLGAGGDSNILKSGDLELESSLFRATIDLGLSLGSEPSRQWNLYTYLQQVEYVDVELESPKQMALIQLQHKRIPPSQIDWGFNLEYLYYTLFDSENAVQDEPLPMIKNDQTSMVPFWEYRWENGISTMLEIPFSRFQTDDDADEYNSAGIKLTINKSYHRRSYLGLQVSAVHRTHPSGEALDLDGEPISGTNRQLDISRLELHQSHVGQSDNEWNLKSTFLLEEQRDNGPGYFDYDSYSLTLSGRYPDLRWSVRGRIALGFLKYTERTIVTADGESELLTTQTAEFGIDATYKIGSNKRIVAEINQLQSISNYSSDDFTDLSFLISATLTI